MFQNHEDISRTVNMKYIYIYTSAVKGHCGSQKPDPQLIFGQSGKYHTEVILEWKKNPSYDVKMNFGIRVPT